jgi:hypothetical protein
MIASFFRHLERHQVKWLLISGQATILYGAATFSEDIDLWVEPTEANLERVRSALRASQARYYKLTPAFTATNAAEGHGFHFVVPGAEDDPEVFVDVMGVPPRVGSFDAARSASRTFETLWGTLHTIGIKDLVELKKTQRPRDYPIIGRLALTWLEERASRCSSEDLEWVLSHMFSVPELVRLFIEHPALSVSLPSSTPRLVVQAADQLARHGQLDQSLEDALEELMDQRVAPLRRADRHFWRPVIESLRQLRARGELEAEGALV